MTRPVDPDLVRKLADCIERLPNHVNDPRRMPFVQETLRSAFERFRFDRKAIALGSELRGDLCKAEQYRQPVASVLLLDDEKRAIEEGFEHDEATVFELFEYVAAEIGEWLKDRRHARDAERFRAFLKFVCGEALVMPAIGVEVRPGVYKLDLDSWTDEAAKPLCNYLRELADEMATEPPPRVRRASLEETILVRLDEDNWTATRNGETADFRGQQIPWKLFCRLLRAQGQVMPYAELLKAGWTEEDIVIEDNLRPHITTIRKLIAPLGLEVKPHRKHGYSLCCTEPRKNQI